MDYDLSINAEVDRTARLRVVIMRWHGGFVGLRTVLVCRYGVVGI